MLILWIWLDGGGVRGYASLLILKALMSKIQQLEQDQLCQGDRVASSADYPWMEKEPSKSSLADANKFYPCHYFDYMVGTSTGG
jgi:patatin-like phospholipase/acyl hydrolase